MNDSINRQAAVSICDNAIDLWNGQLDAGALVAVRDAIKALPSAQQCEYWDSESNHCALYRPSAQPIDAVEVVRCKDCYHYDEENEYCIFNDREMKLLDFCSYGSK